MRLAQAAVTWKPDAVFIRSRLNQESKIISICLKGVLTIMTFCTSARTLGLHTVAITLRVRFWPWNTFYQLLSNLLSLGPLLLLEKCDQNVSLMSAVVKISCCLHCSTLWKGHLALQLRSSCSELCHIYSLHVLQKFVLELYNTKHSTCAAFWGVSSTSLPCLFVYGKM